MMRRLFKGTQAIINLMIPIIIAFLVMLNPFAMFLYLLPVMNDLKNRVFLKVLLKATVISFIIFTIFLFIGDFLFEQVFQIGFEPFRIFGGIVIFSYAYFFIVKGQKAFIHMKENLDDLASEIALPFMVGAGTLTLTLLMAHQIGPTDGILALILILTLNYFFITLLKFIRDSISKTKLKVAFDKNMEIFLRLNGFFLGAIGINMMVIGINNTFFI
jgi:multiple antibiotic resistance protein